LAGLAGRLKKWHKIHSLSVDIKMKQSNQTNMKINLALYTLSMGIILFLSSCELAGDIFKTGVGVGVFAVIAVIVLIIFLVSRSSKKG
jgi:hypothetical protein